MNQIEWINGKKVEYIDDTHTYIVDGVVVPSVTQIVSTVLPSPYKNIEPDVLKQAADRGIALHEEIEQFEKDGVMGSSIEFNHYLYLKKQYVFDAVDNEKLIVLEYNGKVICAGRLDMIIQIGGKKDLGIGDIKRTYQLHMDHLKLQLNLYRLGYMQSYGKHIDYLKCLHLRKWTYGFVDVPIDEDYARTSIKRYLEVNETIDQ
ncbi:MAG: hypothetical protein A2Y45_04120 [Tenericutes bacterium GWC2_34_14]|nr:MAG: hypothetical protein A2Y45_04120 [Tenericutes bacterium GWC2_34_14]OHE33344.1 MAG: hypothetical protein A2012_05900 [Tenericutes bacterium GWE2_34_108]OHE36495.1 MAG: hypothetical protein A2Y46_08005 [Tenericutes bacterium GWF1_35_14]OHE37699.1 MAG: hypothetical protein A2Y44_02930 [Tenericutes bacterium GWF2_35_184]OHE41374.1 MAG: hypothetical protein A3K26_06385 [Tenericutes bacterium RIFOXYA12_FULL_35_10]OHE45151.1 MAG: hypothetical protein A2221_02580 [Tenericutes bacterium RIFOXYA